MTNRRQFLAGAAAAAVLGPLAAWLGRPVAVETAAAAFPSARADGEWRARLTPAEYRVLRQQATERPYTSALNHEKRHGIFACAGCGRGLFSSAAKFDSGTGWPSFWEPLPVAVATSVDRSFFTVRLEVHCVDCGGHLGHVFDDGPPPTGLRYCINGVALRFTPAG